MGTIKNENMRKILLTIGFLICVVFAKAQSPVQWTISATPAQVRNGFNSNFNYVYANKADKSNPIIIGTIKISDGTNVTDSAALRSWVRSYVSTHGGGGGSSMVYPGVGIPLSSGSAWGTSIANNSNNWNTAYTDRLKWDGGSTGLTATTGRTSLGATITGSALFTLTNPSAISFIRVNADNSVSALNATDFKTALSLTSGDASAIATQIADTFSTRISHAKQLSDYAVMTADSATNKYATKKQARDYAGGGTSGSLPVLSSNPSSGNIYLSSVDKRIHYLANNYWYRLAVIDSATASSTSTLLKGLISAYECNESSGTIIDAKGINSSSSQTVTYGNAGKNGNCLTFTGTNIVTLSNTTGWTPSSTSFLTVSLWVNFTSALPGNYGHFIGFENGPQVYVALNTSDPAYKFKWYAGGGTIESTNDETFTHNTWYNVVVVKSGTSISLYKNDVLVGSGTESTYSALNPTHIYIGNDGSGEKFTGKIDMIRLYNRALSSSGVDSLYTKENSGITYPW
jgi:hypothetical protein